VLERVPTLILFDQRTSQPGPDTAFHPSSFPSLNRSSELMNRPHCLGTFEPMLPPLASSARLCVYPGANTTPAIHGDLPLPSKSVPPR